MDFPGAVKLVREKLSMSQEELAHALNISFATINRWENGKTHPNKMAKSVFFAFCEQHGIDIKTMFVKKPCENGYYEEGGKEE
jgi:putative transcriptional regulator